MHIVSWEIFVYDQDDPVSAVRKAIKCLERGHCSWGVRNLVDGEYVVVDLADPDNPEIIELVQGESIA